MNVTMSILINENIQLSELPNCSNNYYIKWEKELDEKKPRDPVKN